MDKITQLENRVQKLELKMNQDNFSGLEIFRKRTQFLVKPEINTGILVSAHFYPVLLLKTITVYISDGTTPHGNLSGNAGDICFGADSGKAYKCTSTTTWVSFT